MALDHPNVVKVFDALETEDGSPMLVMELLVGESLGERLSLPPAVEPIRAQDEPALTPNPNPREALYRN